MQTAVQRATGSGVVDPADIARVLGTTARSVQRWAAHAAAPRRDTEERLLELATVLDLAIQILPADEARLWIRSPAAQLAWRKPLDVIRDGAYRQVIDILTAPAAGVIGPAATLREWLEGNPRNVLTPGVDGLDAGGRQLVQDVLDGKPLSEEHARVLEWGTGTPACFWLNYERTYRAGLNAGMPDVTPTAVGGRGEGAPGKAGAEGER
jgi:putative toxin-antitoxin system antitoxin component (TIGR02293 family)